MKTTTIELTKDELRKTIGAIDLRIDDLEDKNGGNKYDGTLNILRNTLQKFEEAYAQVKGES